MNNRKKAEKVFDLIRADSALVAILEHLGQVQVPLDNFNDLITDQQVWPNDFIYKHGSSMRLSYDEASESILFDLRYKNYDDDIPKGILGYQCTRNMSDVGFVDHDSPLYRS